MTVAQLLAYFAAPNRANYEQMNEFPASANEYARLLKSEKFTNVIFPKRNLVTDIFGPRGANIEQHKYLAHVRRVNTTGMPDVGVDEEGTFSVIVSHRTGELLRSPYSREDRLCRYSLPLGRVFRRSPSDIH